MQITKVSIQNIEKIFEKGLQDDYLTRSIGKIIEYEKEKTSKDIQTLKNEIELFERKYNMSSIEFFEKFEKGVLGDDEDYFEWSALFQMYRRSVELLGTLEGVS